MNATARNLFGAVLDAERLRNARGLLVLRAALTLAALGVTAFTSAMGVRGATARLPILGAYCALSLALFAIGRRSSPGSRSPSTCCWSPRCNWRSGASTSC